MRLHRRDLLKSAIGASAMLSFAPHVPGWLCRAANAAAASRDISDAVLVIVQLTGGNDGLNTVVPYQDDAYGRHRRSLRLTAAEVHPIDGGLGLHPDMEALWRLYQEGTVGIVQGVGYPRSSRDHDSAMRDWQTAQPGNADCWTGWAGRAADWAARQGCSPLPAAFVGSIPLPGSLAAAEFVVPSIRRLDQLRMREDGGVTSSDADGARAAAVSQQSASQNRLRAEIVRAAAQARAGSLQVQQLLRAETERGDVPPLLLAQHLAMVVQLIRADLGLRIFCVELGGGGLGGFDNHANQRDNHAALLRQLSESIASFAAQLHRHGFADRVLLATYSEFGRTVVENGRLGTDHGEAAPVILVGGRVRGGLVGQHPDLGDLAEGAPRFHTDFRSVYATLLDRWLGFDSSGILGGTFSHVTGLELS